MEKVRIGVIGCGGIANNKHMPAYKNNANAEMVAFCDIIVERAEKAACVTKILEGIYESHKTGKPYYFD